MGDVVVKVDGNLLKKVEEIIRESKFLYTCKKQVVNLALVEFLSKHGNIKSKKRKKGS